MNSKQFDSTCNTVDTNHAPRYQYDCERCKFNWCCGKVSACLYRRRLPLPPIEVQQEVNLVKMKKNHHPEYMDGEALEQLPAAFKAKIMQEILEKE